LRQRLLSQESLAKALDINQAAVSKMERRTDLAQLHPGDVPGRAGQDRQLRHLLCWMQSFTGPGPAPILVTIALRFHQEPTPHATPVG
jgi:hypothetical protein